MWMPNISIAQEEEEGEDTWELARAFAKDTRSMMGTNCNWPPRSYTCTFCRREFRSAQALGGHMNVHRRDRARLHHQSTVQDQTRSVTVSMATTSPTSSLFYQVANCRSTNVKEVQVMPSSVGNSLPISIYTDHNYNEMQVISNEMSNNGVIKVNHQEKGVIEELDLELRLGHIPTSASHEKLFENNNNVSLLNFR